MPGLLLFARAVACPDMHGCALCVAYGVIYSEITLVVALLTYAAVCQVCTPTPPAVRHADASGSCIDIAKTDSTYTYAS